MEKVSGYLFGKYVTIESDLETCKYAVKLLGDYFAMENKVNDKNTVYFDGLEEEYHNEKIEYEKSKS